MPASVSWGRSSADQAFDLIESQLPNIGHIHQLLNIAKWAIIRTVIDDILGCLWPNAWQGIQLLQCGGIDIDQCIGDSSGTVILSRCIYGSLAGHIYLLAILKELCQVKPIDISLVVESTSCLDGIVHPAAAGQGI
jgi:hypothetical protein